MEGTGNHVGAEAVGMETTGTTIGECLVSPFIPALLGYMGRVIGENVGRGGKRRGKGRSLECEFVVLSR